MAIFIQIASYRDPELLPTLINAVNQADKPNELSFGICHQYDWPDSIPRFEQIPNCKLLLIKASETGGMCWARWMAQQLWNGEEWWLQIDSHMRFVSGWDTLLVDSWKQCQDNKAVLSTYCPTYELEKPLTNTLVTRIVPKEFFNKKILLLQGSNFITEQNPQLGYLLSGHFIFAPAKHFKEVPSDPNVFMLGDEPSLAVRAWTYGWNIYHPHQVILYHQNRTDGQTRGRFWEDDKDWWVKENRSEDRLKAMLEGDTTVKSFDKFGLGNKRSLAEYELFSGINFKAQTFSKNAALGIPNLNYK